MAHLVEIPGYDKTGSRSFATFNSSFDEPVEGKGGKVSSISSSSQMGNVPNKAVNLLK
jgi:hypothetical protein